MTGALIGFQIHEIELSLILRWKENFTQSQCFFLFFRAQMKSTISGVSTFSFFGSGQDLVFDAYIQYKEYIGFVKAMNSLKGMKLCCKDRHEDRSWTANIKVMSIYFDFCDVHFSNNGGDLCTSIIICQF